MSISSHGTVNAVWYTGGIAAMAGRWSHQRHQNSQRGKLGQSGRADKRLREGIKSLRLMQNEAHDRTHGRRGYVGDRKPPHNLGKLKRGPACSGSGW